MDNSRNNALGTSLFRAFALSEILLSKTRSLFFRCGLRHFVLRDFASALGYIMWNKGIDLWGGKAATLWVYTIPVFTVIADIVFSKFTFHVVFCRLCTGQEQGCYWL